jgi:hypothetical protein
MPKSSLCRHTGGPPRFFLIADGLDIEVHAAIRKIVANELKPAFIGLTEGGTFAPRYVKVVSRTPQEILHRAAG